jgi:head-tail adaptor
MQSGELRSRISFHKRIVIDDGYGNERGGYSEVAEFTVAARVKPKLGGESVLASRLTGTNFVNITVRRSSSTVLVGEDWIAKDARSGVVYNIRSIIDPNEGDADRGKWIEMLAEKGVATGAEAIPVESLNYFKARYLS